MFHHLGIARVFSTAPGSYGLDKWTKTPAAQHWQALSPAYNDRACRPEKAAVFIFDRGAIDAKRQCARRDHNSLVPPIW